MKRRHLLAASAAALARPALAQPQYASVLRFVPEADLPSPDPHRSDSRITRDHALLVFDTLFGIDSEGRPQPQMLETYRVEQGGLQWRLSLRNGLYFHTLERVLARDCVASIRRWAARDPYGQALMAATGELAAIDDRTILFRLKTPFPLLPDVLGKTTGPICAMLPSRVAATDPGVEIAEIVGSGPFRYAAAEREPGKRVVYLRHEPYVPQRAATSGTAGAKEAFIERIEWQVMPDADAATALLRGAVDWWGSVAPAQMAALRKSPDVKLPLLAKDGLVATLRPNHAQPPFDKPAIRRALLGAISQHDCMVALNGDDGPAWRDDAGFFVPGPKLAAAPLPQDEAKRAVAAAGYTGDLVRLLVPAGRLAPLGETIAGLLRVLGMNVAIQGLAPAAMAQALASREPVAAGGWSLALGETEAAAQADPVGHALLRGNGRDAAPGWPASPQLETLRTAWLAAPDPAWQARIAAQMQAQAMQDVPYIPLGISFPRSAHRSGLIGLIDGPPLFWSVRRK